MNYSGHEHKIILSTFSVYFKETIINIRYLFLLLKIERIKNIKIKKKGHQYKVEYPKVPDLIYSARYGPNTRGVVTSDKKTYLKNSLCLHTTSRNKNIHVKMFKSNIEISGAQDLNEVIEITEYLRYRIFKIQETLIFMKSHPKSTLITLDWVKRHTKGVKTLAIKGVNYLPKDGEPIYERDNKKYVLISGKAIECDENYIVFIKKRNDYIKKLREMIKKRNDNMLIFNNVLNCILNMNTRKHAHAPALTPYLGVKYVVHRLISDNDIVLILNRLYSTFDIKTKIPSGFVENTNGALFSEELEDLLTNSQIALINDREHFGKINLPHLNLNVESNIYTFGGKMWLIEGEESNPLNMKELETIWTPRAPDEYEYESYPAGVDIEIAELLLDKIFWFYRYHDYCSVISALCSLDSVCESKMEYDAPKTSMIFINFYINFSIDIEKIYMLPFEKFEGFYLIQDDDNTKFVKLQMPYTIPDRLKQLIKTNPKKEKVHTIQIYSQGRITVCGPHLELNEIVKRKIIHLLHNIRSDITLKQIKINNECKNEKLLNKEIMTQQKRQGTRLEEYVSPDPNKQRFTLEKGRVYAYDGKAYAYEGPGEFIIYEKGNYQSCVLIFPFDLDIPGSDKKPIELPEYKGMMIFDLARRLPERVAAEIRENSYR